MGNYQFCFIFILFYCLDLISSCWFIIFTLYILYKLLFTKSMIFTVLFYSATCLLILTLCLTPVLWLTCIQCLQKLLHSIYLYLALKKYCILKITPPFSSNILKTWEDSLFPITHFRLVILCCKPSGCSLWGSLSTRQNFWHRNCSENRSSPSWPLILGMLLNNQVISTPWIQCSPSHLHFHLSCPA